MRWLSWHPEWKSSWVYQKHVLKISRMYLKRKLWIVEFSPVYFFYIFEVPVKDMRFIFFKYLKQKINRIILKYFDLSVPRILIIWNELFWHLLNSPIWIISKIECLKASIIEIIIWGNCDCQSPCILWSNLILYPQLLSSHYHFGYFISRGRGRILVTHDQEWVSDLS